MSLRPRASPSFALPAAGLRVARTRGRVGWALLIAVTLAFKSFVPLLAAASAEWQGKAVADICSVYGVRLAPASNHVHHAASHGAAHAALAFTGTPAGDPHSHHDPSDHLAHAKDHCALTGLAACALFAPTPWLSADWLQAGGLRGLVPEPAEPLHDASARWLSLRLHAPPFLV